MHNSSVSLSYYSDLVERTVTLPFYRNETGVIGKTRMRGNNILCKNLTSTLSALQRENEVTGLWRFSPQLNKNWKVE